MKVVCNGRCSVMLSRWVYLIKTDQKRAFTLIEILLVVVLISVMAALTIPNFSPTYKKFQLKQSAKDLTYSMRYAQGRSVARNTVVRLAFDDDFKKYWLEIKQSGNDLQEHYQRINSRMGRTFSVPDGTDIEFDKPYIYFYPDGSIDKLRLYVCQDVRCMTVSTLEQRGFVRLYDIKLNTGS